jgi:hypothetical protein
MNRNSWFWMLFRGIGRVAFVIAIMLVARNLPVYPESGVVWWFLVISLFVAIVDVGGVAKRYPKRK